MAVGAKRRKRQRAKQNTQAIQHRQPVRELIGRDDTYQSARMSIYRQYRSIDASVPNYEFFDKLRRGKAKGYSLGGLFCKPIEDIFAGWVFGKGVTIALTESGDPENDNDPRNYTDGLIADFIKANITTLLTVESDKLGLGDQYIIVNADASLSIPSPETVTVKRNDIDYRTVESYCITTVLEKYTIVDEYRIDGRTLTIKQGDKVINTLDFQNLIGRFQVVHLANGMSGNEVFGHSIHDDMLPLYNEYDDVIYKQIDGAKLLGNPLLAFVGMEDLTQVMNANQLSPAETYQDINGNVVERPQLKIDSNAALLVGKGGDAKFVAPPTGFTGDTQQSLKTLFLLLLDHTRIPEFVWGNELSGAHATTDVQVKQWVSNIETRQKSDEGWLLELCAVWLATAALVDPGIVVDALSATWPKLVDEDRKTTLEYIKEARAGGVLTDKTFLELLDLVDDPQAEAQAAHEEAEERQAALFPDGPLAPTGPTMPEDDMMDDAETEEETG